MHDYKSQVLVLGCWHLGSVVGACLAEAGNAVYLYDQSPLVTSKWRTGHPPLHEPGLDELAGKHWKRHLFFLDKMDSVISQRADWIIISYDTQINEQDEVILDSVESGFKEILKAGFSEKANFLFTSQLPVGTTRKFRNQIAKANPKWEGHVTYIPENLRLGDAIKSFQQPDRMVLGVDTFDADNEAKLTRAFQDLIANDKTPINVMRLESAEMVKHALNSFLGTCVVFANNISELCEHNGADAWDVLASLKSDTRVGPKAYLRPGLGFSGGTLARDVKILGGLASKRKANFFSQLYQLNSDRNLWVLDSLLANLKTLRGKRVVLLGITYKPFTSTVRRSPALDIARLLKQEGAHCVAIDPKADIEELGAEELRDLPFSLETNAEAAFRGADAAVLVTEWPDFLDLDWKKLRLLMNTHLIVDSKHHFQHSGLESQFKMIVPGKPQPPAE